MRIGVIGAGAVGGTIAAVLERGGHDVEVTARGDHLAAIRRGGLRLRGAFGEHTSWIRSGETLDLAPEIAFLCTKAQDAEDAARANARVLSGVPVVVVQNGLDGLTATARLLRESECVGALALFAASHLEPGTIDVTAGGDIYLGAASGPPTPLVGRVAELLGSEIPTRTSADFVGAQWTKLLVNQVNAMPTVTGLSVQDTISDPRLARIVARSLREAARIGVTSGVRFDALQGLDDRIVRIIARFPPAAARSLLRAMSRRMGSVPNPGSTLQSVKRGQTTEIDHLNGAVVRAAQRIGREAPVNAALVELVHEVEREGRHLSAEEVVARFSTVH